ncbi:KTSC domain-containing protein [Bradyrhizobium sp. 48]|uniref:KTSC domain-containing protein n=1 Tax=Bradyrhizobium TaxID=374 RepID=UPI001FF734F3|nr:KTSC domain-containing protein [Bradyrhizobium sp. 48]MCK1441476.1 KTSC domain-containing protein [Bradyrhizobium sp. 48]
MNWIETPDSSTIARFVYDGSRQVLIVEFKSGGRYEYYDVPEAAYDDFVRAGSKGQYLAQNIKGAYRYARA